MYLWFSTLYCNRHWNKSGIEQRIAWRWNKLRETPYRSWGKEMLSWSHSSKSCVNYRYVHLEFVFTNFKLVFINYFEFIIYYYLISLYICIYKFQVCISMNCNYFELLDMERGGETESKSRTGQSSTRNMKCSGPCILG